MIDSAGDHSVHNGQTVEHHQVSHAWISSCSIVGTDETVSDHRHP
jgi:hypothetical protein